MELCGFSINIVNAEALAIKYQNNDKSTDLFYLEITIMKKLKKYKIFAKLQDNFILNLIN